MILYVHYFAVEEVPVGKKARARVSFNPQVMVWQEGGDETTMSLDTRNKGQCQNFIVQGNTY